MPSMPCSSLSWSGRAPMPVMSGRVGEQCAMEMRVVGQGASERIHRRIVEG